MFVRFSRTKRRELLAAAEAGQVETVRSLLDQGVKVNSTNDAGLTALHLAARANQVETVKLLLDRGASTLQPNDMGMLAKELASQNTAADVVPILAQHDEAELREAARRGASQRVVDLLRSKTDPNAQDSKGKTALMVAVLHNKAATVRKLLKYAVDVNLTDAEGYTALHYAASLGYLDCIKALLSASEPDVLVKTPDGKTAQDLVPEKQRKDVVDLLNPLKEARLIRAARAQDLDVLGALLDLGTMACACDAFGDTPLHFAAFYGNLDMISLLSERGARPSLRDDYGQTAYEIALLEHGHSSPATKLLREISSHSPSLRARYVPDSSPGVLSKKELMRSKTTTSQTAFL